MTDFTTSYLRWRSDRAADAFRRAAKRYFFSLDRKFDPDQPRVPAGQTGGGQWAGGNTFTADPSAATPSNDDLTNGASSEEELPALRIAGRSQFSAAECGLQYKLDIFHCKMVGSPACYA